MKPPELDKRTYRDIVHQALRLARTYFPTGASGVMKWDSIHELADKPINKDDPAYKLMEIFARLMELLIQRLNRIPVKNFLSFLEMVGVEQQVGNPAEVPVTFLPAKSALTGGHIPKGTRVATTQTDTANAFVFETREAFFATPAKLKKVVNLIPGMDRYSLLPLLPQPPAPQDLEDDSRAITAFAGHDDSLSHIEHVLYIGSESLFAGEETAILSLEISLSGGDDAIFNDTYLQWQTYNEENKAWENIEAAVTYTIESDPHKVVVTIDGFTGTAKSEVNHIEGFWIACFTGELTGEMEIPQITGISGQVIPLDGEPGDPFTTKIDVAFSNSTVMDPSKPIYPFGQRPQYGDAFYIGSEQAFAPGVDEVTLVFTVHQYKDSDIEDIFKNMRNSTTERITTVVQWEYLDNSGTWNTLSAFEHEVTVTRNSDATFSIGHATRKFVNDAEVTNTNDEDGTFIPLDPDTANTAKIILSGLDDPGLNEINKVENYWIRAVVKEFNAYGKDAWLESTEDTPQPFVVIGPTFIPPIIEDIQISYTYKSDPISVDSIQTENNFRYTLQEGNFTPFIPVTSYAVGNNTRFIDTQPALYMGFDKEFGDVYISLFVHLDEAFSPAGYALEQGNPHITWEYAASDYTWKPLDVKDSTANLTASGTVAFTGPGDSIKVSLFKSLCQDEETPEDGLYWYRARLAHGYYDYPPQINGIYLNTVMADNRVVSREDQVVGSGNGTANQKLTLIRAPVLAGEIWVRETEPPGEEELEDLQQEFAHSRENKEETGIPDLVHKVTASDGKEETWVQWLKVPNFLTSGPRSRHYTLDAVNGQINFGNNEHGLIPPAGKDNIIIKNYRTGGGEQANKAASPLAVKELKSSLPYVDKVFNVQYAVAGSNPWTLEQTMAFGPQSIKNRGRAVTIEDYEWMVLQHFSQVARTRCIPTRVPGEGGSLLFKPGTATLIIVPKTTDPKPQPPKGLLKNIRDYLRQKALGNIFEDIHVIGPDFKEINISAVVKPVRPGETSIVERRIIKNLEDFFHPLTGGEQKNGWAFGRDVYISEVYAVIERTQGVNYVKNAWFTNKPGAESLEIGNNCLVYSGTHKITME